MILWAKGIDDQEYYDLELIKGCSEGKLSAQGVATGFYIEPELTRKISVRPGLAMARQ